MEDTFLIKTRGLVPVPGIIPQGDERFRTGGPSLIMLPDGSKLDWTIGGIAMIAYSDPTKPRKDVVILLRDLGKEDVPIGSEIWSVDATE